MKKLYFIQDLEKILGVHRKTYFYWERTGKVPKAKRTVMGNYRYWTEEEINRLKKITKGQG
ncbi:MAG: MerR family transcriptional regulator [Candidatus Omnitrophota bacterium]